jgi:hypothetical protein
VLVIEAVHQLFPWLRHLFADSVYNGASLHEARSAFTNGIVKGRLNLRGCPPLGSRGDREDQTQRRDKKVGPALADKLLIVATGDLYRLEYSAPRSCHPPRG